MINEDDLNKFERLVRRSIEFDDTMASVIPEPKVGSKVKYKDDGGVGTIIQIALTNTPFRVEWDNCDTVDKKDWYKGDQLELE